MAKSLLCPSTAPEKCGNKGPNTSLNPHAHVFVPTLPDGSASAVGADDARIADEARTASRCQPLRCTAGEKTGANTTSRALKISDVRDTQSCEGGARMRGSRHHQPQRISQPPQLLPPPPPLPPPTTFAEGRSRHHYLSGEQRGDRRHRGGSRTDTNGRRDIRPAAKGQEVLPSSTVENVGNDGVDPNSRHESRGGPMMLQPRKAGRAGRDFNPAQSSIYGCDNPESDDKSRRPRCATRANDKLAHGDCFAARNRRQRRRNSRDQRFSNGSTASASAHLRSEPANGVSHANSSVDHGDGVACQKSKRKGRRARPSSSSTCHTLFGDCGPVVGRYNRKEQIDFVAEHIPGSIRQATRNDDEKAFPALSSVTLKGNGCHHNSPKLLPAHASQPQGLDYSSLANRLARNAKDAAAADAAEATESQGASTASGPVQLSILRGGKEGKSEENVGIRLGKDPQRGASGANTLRSLPQPKPPLSVPPASIVHDVTQRKQRPGVCLATADVRDRLRERWFRLEALKKAERQRETAERERMATEDANVMDEGIGLKFAGSIAVDGIVGEKLCQLRVSDGSSGVPSLDHRVGGDRISRDSDSGTERTASNHYSGSTALSKNASFVFTTTTSHNANDVELGNRKVVLTPEKIDTESVSSLAQSDADVSQAASRPISASGAAAICRANAEVQARSQELIQTELVDRTGQGVAPSAPVGTIDDSKEPGFSTYLENIQACADDHTEVLLKAAKSTAEHRAGVDHRVVETAHYSVGDAAEVSDSIHSACEAGKAEELKSVPVRSAGRAADSKDKLRRTPLHLAAEAASLECVLLLLKQGARLDQRDRWRETPLHKAARRGSAEVVKALCAARMKVNIRNRYRETPLLLAVRADSEGAVASLLAFGARLNDPDIHGVTPVCHAAMSGQSELLMSMVNSNQACWKSSPGSTHPSSSLEVIVDTSSLRPAISTRSSTSDPVPPRWSSAAGRGGSDRVGKRRLSSSLRWPWTTKGGNGDAACTGGRSVRGERGQEEQVPILSPIHETAGAGQVETLSLLLELGVSMDDQDIVRSGIGAAGDTPLGRAVRAGKLDCARILLDAGAIICRENARGETPLVVAIRAGQAAAVELLVQRGAALDSARVSGGPYVKNGRPMAAVRAKTMARRRTEPLELALREGQLACAAGLIEGGARITERALQAMKLEAPLQAAEIRPAAAESQHYAGGDRKRTSAATAYAAPATATTSARPHLLSLQMDILGEISPKVKEILGMLPPMEDGLLEDSDFIKTALLVEASKSRRCACGQGVSGKLLAGSHGTDTISRNEDGCHEKSEDVHGLLPGLGECDVVLVLADGSRLPVHSCLLLAFSGEFRDLFVLPSGSHHGPRPRGDVCHDTCHPSLFCPLSAFFQHHKGEDVSESLATDRVESRGRESVVTEASPSSKARRRVDAFTCETGHTRASVVDTNVPGSDKVMPEPVSSLIRHMESDVRDLAEIWVLAKHSEIPPPQVVATSGRSMANTVDNANTVVFDAEDRRIQTTAIHAVLVQKTSESHHETEGGRVRIPKNVMCAASNIAKAGTLGSAASAPRSATVLAAEAAAARGAASADGPLKTLVGKEPGCGSPVIGWGLDTGEVFVRFWEAGTMALIIQHIYSGLPPIAVKCPQQLARLLVAACSLRIPRLMRQVEHLLFATLSTSPNGKRLTDPTRAATLLRAARALGAVDLESGCTLLLQANGCLPTVMKIRRELGVLSLNAADVGRGLEKLTGRGYLGSGPAHSWSSAGVSTSAVRSGGASAGSAAVTTAAAKRAADLIFRKRAVDFDQLAPLLLDPARCSSTLSIRSSERILLVHSAMREACAGTQQLSSVDPEYEAGDDVFHCRCVDGGLTAAPRASNFSAFSHGVGWLFRTGAVADVTLVLAPSMEDREQTRQPIDPGEDKSTGDHRSQVRSTAQRQEKYSPGSGGRRSTFLAHSMILAARSEKFAAMLRFVRRQDDQCLPSTARALDRDLEQGMCSDVECRTSGDCPNNEKEVYEDNDVHDEVHGRDVDGCGCGSLASDHVSCDALGRGRCQSETTLLGIGRSCATSTICSNGSHEQCGHSVRDAVVHCKRGGVARLTQGRRISLRTPRELELRSPLLSPRLLSLFLEFCYSGVLRSSVSVTELSLLALVADEYLVTDLTRQAENLLVEHLAAQGTETHNVDSEEAASTPLDLLQLGVTLGLGTLSAAAARAVLLHLAQVCTSEAFLSSGMTRTELVLAALEAAR